MSERAFAGARVAVLGLGRTGAAVARVLVSRGAKVRVLEAKDDPKQREVAAGLEGIDVVLGRVEAADVLDHELVVASPGVPPHSPWVRAADDAGITVWGDIELAYRLGVRPAVGITGTNGKTTTTEMVVAALRACGRRAVAAGNIGVPLVDLSAGDAAIVAELSSFQLERIDAFRAPVAVLLNVAADHLDWHGSVERYHEAKSRLFQTQERSDVAIFHDDATARAVAAGGPARGVPFHEDALPAGGAGVEDGWIVVPEGRVVEVDRLRASGRPVRADAVAAAAAVCAMGCEPARVGDALAAYEQSPHRVEVVDVIDGVTYVNDSKATSPHATIAALEGMRDVVLIAGGLNKDLDLGELAVVTPSLRGVVAIGRAADDVVRAFEPSSLPVERAVSMEDAVSKARALARDGDTVMLSPACASQDMFGDYAERGEAFKREVARLGRGRA